MNDVSLAGRTVCIVDDDELVRKSIAMQLLQRGIIALEAADGADLSGLLDRHHIDCILMDIQLVGENGLYLQAQLRDRHADVPPVVMLTSSEDQRTIIKAFRAGVSDYLVKRGLRLEELVQTLRSAIDRRQLDTAVRSELESLKRRSQFDDETGLYRREAVEAMMAEMSKARADTRKAFAILLIRINQYDTVGDHAGLIARRQLIRAVTQRLRNAIRKMDVCGRFDDRTFIYLVDMSSIPDDMLKVAMRLDAELRFDLDLDAVSLGVSASFGIALFPDSALDPAGLIRCAEEELGGTAGHEARLLGDSGHSGEDGAARVGERRRSQRHRVFKSGKIIVNGGQAVLDCTVRDQSEGGARLRLAGVFSLPACFDLLVVGSGPGRAVRQVWRRGSEVGVSYTG